MSGSPAPLELANLRSGAECDHSASEGSRFSWTTECFGLGTVSPAEESPSAFHTTDERLAGDNDRLHMGKTEIRTAKGLPSDLQRSTIRIRCAEDRRVFTESRIRSFACRFRLGSASLFRSESQRSGGSGVGFEETPANFQFPRWASFGEPVVPCVYSLITHKAERLMGEILQKQ